MAAQSNQMIAVFIESCTELPFRSWHKFKDFSRTALTPMGHQPGFTDMASKPGGTTGYTLCRKREDAQYIYERLVDLTRSGTPMRIHWYDATYSNTWPVRCNCAYEPHQAQEQHGANQYYYQHYAQFMKEYVDPTRENYAPPENWKRNEPCEPLLEVTNSMQSPSMGTNYGAASTPYCTIQQPSPAAQYSPNVQYQTNYVQNSQGYPVNATNGLVQSEHTKVIFKNLVSSVTDEELLENMPKSTAPIGLHVRRSSDSQKRTTTAIGTFSCHKDAKRVIDHFRKKKIHIRHREVNATMAKDSSPRSTMQPTVVNGSTAIRVTSQTWESDYTGADS